MEKLPKKTSDIKRFKVPEMVYELQGTKTVIRNFGDILTAIRRDVGHLSKYLFKELATPGNVQGNLLILQAKIPKDSLLRKINDYMKEFVYCKVCGEPDTKLIKEDRLIFMVCEACGAKTPKRQI